MIVKAFFIVSSTNEMHKHVESFTYLNGNEVEIYSYNHRGGNLSGASLDSEINRKASEYKPDMIVYVGACSGNIPSPELFRKLQDELAPTVLFVSDAADVPWWNLINRYEESRSFSVQVALDGNFNWPGKDKHITALTPISPEYFISPPKPHSDRIMMFGYAGQLGHPRRVMIAQMIQFGLTTRQRQAPSGGLESDSLTYRQAALFMSNTRIMPNFCATGSNQTTHVKGRVVEAGWAGCLLLEQAGSPTSEWFEKGVDYLEWKDIGEVKEIVDKFKDKPEESQAFGERLRKKVMDKHSPEKFWNAIFERINK